MTKLAALLLLAFATAPGSFAQTIKLNKDTSAFAKSPLYIIKFPGDTKEYAAVPLMWLIDNYPIARMDILTNKTADSLYGTKGKNGVIIITLTKHPKIYPVNYLFDQYKIKPKFRALPLYINTAFTGNTTDIFYAPAKIKSIAVAKEKGTGMKYVSIITTDYSPNVVPDTAFRIKGLITSGI